MGIAHQLILVINRLSIFLTIILVGGLALLDARAQVQRSTPRPFARPQPRATPAMKRANELIRRQDPINVSARLLDRLTPDNSHVRVSLSKQRAYLMMGDEIVIDSPISSGKRARPTPQGSFHVLEKDKDHVQRLRRFRRLVRPDCPPRRQQPNRLCAERHALRWRRHEMVHAPNERWRRDARRLPPGLSGIARLHSNAVGQPPRCFTITSRSGRRLWSATKSERRACLGADDSTVRARRYSSAARAKD